MDPIIMAIMKLEKVSPKGGRAGSNTGVHRKTKIYLKIIINIGNICFLISKGHHTAVN